MSAHADVARRTSAYGVIAKPYLQMVRNKFWPDGPATRCQLMRTSSSAHFEKRPLQ